MVAGDSPAVARRRLRLALRRAREAKGLTQGQVADALYWSLSKVNRIESGDVTISNTDLQAVLRLLDVTDPAKVERHMEDARSSRRRGWWDEPRYRDHLTSPMLQLLQFESEASVIRSYQPSLVPGILQTEAYATEVMNFWADRLSKEDRDIRIEVRLRRRDQVLDSESPPQYLVVLSEAVILTGIGDAKVTAEQLAQLLDSARRTAVLLRVLPLADGALLGPLGAFTVFDLGEEENAVLYREAHLLDEIVHITDEVRRHRRIFEQMWDKALSEEASLSLINARYAAVQASLDTGRSTSR